MSAHHLTNGHGPSMILSQEESVRLRACETVIEKGLQTFVEVGASLLEIRDNRYYRQDFDTFEDYCRERWQMSLAHGKRLIAAAEVATNLAPIGAMQPTHESQVRPLTKLEPKQQRQAWREALEASPKPTAALVEKIARRTLEADAPSKPQPTSFTAVLSAEEKEERRKASVAQQEREIKAGHLFIILGSLALGKQSPADTAADLLDYDEEAFRTTQMPLTKAVWEKAIATLNECAKQWEAK